jgi:hypothetical protein
VAFRSFASDDFWKLYEKLPEPIQALADKQYALFQENPSHRSIALKKIGSVWSVRIGNSHRALAYREGDDLFWFWIGSHETYNKLLKRVR